MAVCCCARGKCAGCRLCLSPSTPGRRCASAMSARAFHILVVIVRLRTTLFDKIVRQRRSAALQSLHTGALVPVQFPGDQDNRVTYFHLDQIRCRYDRPGGKRPQQAPFSRGTEEGDSGFNQMTCAVKFMTLRQIAPAFFGCFYRKVSIEIAVFALGGGDQFDYLVGGFSSSASGFWHSDRATASSHLATSLS